MVDLPSNRAVATSYKPLIVTVSPFAAILPQFLIESFVLKIDVSQKQ